MSIATTQAYKNMMEGHEIHSRIVLTIEDGRNTLTLADKDVVRDSLSINWRSTNNGDFSLGTCYAASLSFTALQGMDDQLTGDVLTLTPTVYYDTLNGAEQAIPLGVFECENPIMYTRTTAYECYDKMLHFDKKVTDRVSGTPFNMLAFICEQCGVVLGNTSQEIARMCNSTHVVVLDPLDVETYRDGLVMISALLGCYCQMGRDGKFYLRRFHTTPDLFIIKRRRISTAFMGYETRIAGVKCRFLAEQNYSPYEYITENPGLVVDLGDIPIIEDNPDGKYALLEALYEDIKDIAYYPCEINMVGDPSIEVGDMVTTLDRTGREKNLLLTSVTWNWRSDATITSEGGDPKKDKVTTAEKRAQKQAEKQAENAKVVTATYVNADTIEIDDTEEKDITLLRFVTNRDLTAIFGAEIPVYSDGEGYIKITYSDGGIEGDVVRYRLHAGYNLVTLVNHLHYDANRIVHLFLMAETEGIGTGTAPTVSIERDTIRSYIFAQGMETEAPWDGIISLMDDVPYAVTMLGMQALTDMVTLRTEYPLSNVLADALDEFAMRMQAGVLSDTMILELHYHDDINYCGEGYYAGTEGVLL